MFEIKIRFNDNSTLDYTSNDTEELNKIRHSLENNVPIGIFEGNRTILIVPQNIILVDVKKIG